MIFSLIQLGKMVVDGVYDGLRTFLCYVVGLFFATTKPLLLWLIRDVIPWETFSFVDVPWVLNLLIDISDVVPVVGIVVMFTLYAHSWVLLFSLQKILKAVPALW